MYEFKYTESNGPQEMVTPLCMSLATRGSYKGVVLSLDHFFVDKQTSFWFCDFRVWTMLLGEFPQYTYLFNP